MPSALEPSTAVAYLSQLSADVRAVAVLGRGDVLASALAAQPHEDRAVSVQLRLSALVAAMGRAEGVRIAFGDAKVFARRDDVHALVVVASPLALDDLLWHDLGVILEDLNGASREHGSVQTLGPGTARRDLPARTLDLAAAGDQKLGAAARALADAIGRRNPAAIGRRKADSAQR